ncbi:MAG: mannose-6-phosphate isomerase, class I [Desulfobacterales bacterium]|nr:mannose-6-phosphate isomerase, class I [Desulfobacterales bacterium]
MKTICILKNSVQQYDWGSYTAIAKLLGEPYPSDKPQAELWMGAHPKAPSLTFWEDHWIALPELISKYPKDILGEAVAARFDNHLPYLFKVLSAAKPLSIQAHPSRLQAKKGFERESRLQIPLTADSRNYKDKNHKPECICALTPFWALNGFRPIEDTLALLEKIRPQGLKKLLSDFQKQPDTEGLKFFFKQLMTMEPEQRKPIIADIAQQAGSLSQNDPVFKWIKTLCDAYPSDIGVLAPVLLNLICLQPGQAMFLPTGQLHAYLKGTGIEIMANSDNVLRCGLTPKHVDIAELLNVLNFDAGPIKLLLPRKISDCESIYAAPAEEFVLSVIVAQAGHTYSSPLKRSAEIILCTTGTALLRAENIADPIALTRGSAVLIPAAVEKYTIEGDAVLYKAAVSI